MAGALKNLVLNELRARGFTGSLPHLRRRSSERIDLLSIQYHSAGGSFVVEVASCGAEGSTTGWGKQIPPQKVTAQNIAAPRPRLGSPTFPVGDHWFTFGGRSYEKGADVVRRKGYYEKIARDVLQ